jgi:hypothetical protein
MSDGIYQGAAQHTYTSGCDGFHEPGRCKAAPVEVDLSGSGFAFLGTTADLDGEAPQPAPVKRQALSDYLRERGRPEAAGMIEQAERAAHAYSLWVDVMITNGVICEPFDHLGNVEQMAWHEIGARLQPVAEPQPAPEPAAAMAENRKLRERVAILLAETPRDFWPAWASEEAEAADYEPGSVDIASGQRDVKEFAVADAADLSASGSPGPPPNSTQTPSPRTRRRSPRSSAKPPRGSARRSETRHEPR